MVVIAKQNAFEPKAEVIIVITVVFIFVSCLANYSVTEL